MNLKHSLFVFLPLLLTTLPAKAEVGSALNDRLEAIAQESDLPGFGVALIDRQGTRYAKGFGWADREGQVPFTAQTVQNIGSVSKTFIGVAIMQTVERDLVDLDADINTYLPYAVRNPRFPASPITLRHLATHTSGIEDRNKIYKKAYSAGEKPDLKLGVYLQKYLDRKGQWFSKKNFGEAAPGKRFSYSNIGAALAAHVLEQVNDRGFDALSAELVLKPLGMDDSGWSYDTASREYHAKLYEGQEEVAPYTLVTYPDGGLRTSVKSLARYLTAIANSGQLESVRILPKTAVDAMLAEQFDPEAIPDGFSERRANSGIFWSHSLKGHIGHTGGDPGITTVMSFDPATGLGRIFFTNTMIENKKQAADFKAIWDTLAEELEP